MEQLNQLSIVNIFCSFASTYRESSAIFKKLARSTPVSFDRRDWRTPARLPGQMKQQAGSPKVKQRNLRMPACRKCQEESYKYMYEKRIIY